MIGTQIGNYRIIDKLGEGGMGEVYHAVDVMLERDVALKFLRPELAGQPDLVERFRSEAVVLARLSHPNIASIYGLHREGDLFCMAMEFVRGETLEVLLARDGAFTATRAASVAADVLAALDYAHRLGIVHRDVKTANIIVTAEGVAKVMDFGIARVLGGQRHTKVGFIVGTLAYMSPEQIKGEELDGRSDLYSLGIVLYEMLAGRPPFQADTEWALMQAQVQQAPPPLSTFLSVGPPLETVVSRALEKTPALRFQSAGEFRQALVDGGVLAPTVVVPPTLPPGAMTARVTPLPFASPHAETALHVPGVRPGTGVGAMQPGAGETVVAPAVHKPAVPLPASRPGGAKPKGSNTWVAAAAVLLLAAVAGGAWWVVRGGGIGLSSGEADDLAPLAARELVVGYEPIAPVTPGVALSDVLLPEEPAQVARAATPARPPANPTAAIVPPVLPTPPPIEKVEVTGRASRVGRPVPTAAALPAIRFNKVKLVRANGSDVDALLDLTGDRLVVLNANGSRAFVELPYSSITGATYTESRHNRLVVQTTRHWLTLSTASGETKIRLDKDNYQSVVESFTQRAGKPVAVAEER